MRIPRAALAAAAVAAACSSGRTDPVSSGPPSIGIAMYPPDAIVETAQIDLRGIIDCPGCPVGPADLGYCPSLSCPASAVSVTWTNRTTGASGAASSGISADCACLFSYCWSTCVDRFAATVPLAIGENAIEVVAHDSAGATGSDAHVVTRIPRAPVDLSAEAGRRQVTLRWSDVPEATSYDVYWSTSADVSVATGTRIRGAASPYVHADLADGTTYRYVVTAAAGDHASVASARAWATSGWRAVTLATIPGASWADQDDVAIAVGPGNAVYVYGARGDPYGARSAYLAGSGGAFDAAVAVPPGCIDAELHAGAAGPLLADACAGARTATPATAGGWDVLTIDPAGYGGSALAFDATGHAHLAWFAAGATLEIRYATDAAGAWSAPETVHAFPLLGAQGPGHVAIGADASGTPHVLFLTGYPDYALVHATPDAAGGWTETVVDTGPVHDVSAAVDGAGQVHVAYVGGSGLVHALGSGGAWTRSAVAPSPGLRAAVALDPGGAPRIAFVDGTRGGLALQTGRAEGWTSVLLDETTTAGGSAAIAVDADGSTHVAWFDGDTLRYVTDRF